MHACYLRGPWSFIQIDNSVLNHHKNLQYLAIELYKVFYGISQDIIKDVFKLNTPSQV